MAVIKTEIGRIDDGVGRFFAFARARHAIYERRQGRLPVRGEDFIMVNGHWTRDPILQAYRFTNVFRELDATTVWFRENVRERYAGRAEIIPATVLFRWFNRVTTGETLFVKTSGRSASAATPFERWLASGRLSALRAPLVNQGPPWVTGAYIINTHGLGDGHTKLEGVLLSVQEWMRTHKAWRNFPFTGMRETWAWLQNSPGMGPFMAYEIVCDLRYTHVLADAPDKLTWANPGPGARRGLQRVRDVEGKPRRTGIGTNDAIEGMQWLLALSRDPSLWPHEWPRWEMREVEHTLCEFDKYERTRLGQGRPRGKYP